MINVGIAGLGFMGAMHFGVYSRTSRAKVVAIADTNPAHLAGDWSDLAGNIEGAELSPDLSGVKTYRDASELLHDPGIDVVDVTLPTFMHADFTIAALEAGKHVLCEKPMALNVEECRRMIEAAEAASGKLMIAQCVRFWPEYAELKRMVDEKRYGEVLAASFTRVGPTPAWSWNQWMMDDAKSGDAILDLHIHDADFVQYVFGRPRAVFATGASHGAGVGLCVAQYLYEGGPCVSAQGGWIGHGAFPFRMAFVVFCEKATIELDFARQGAFAAYLADGSTVTPEVPAGDGYELEIDYFLKCVENDTPVELVTPESAMEAVRLVKAEEESIRTGRLVEL